jgi:ATP-dependent exoDNAse (exonuclease V) beta subunit
MKASVPSDQTDRDRFTREWGVNFAVVANAGSGKTTAISKRLVAMARSEAGAKMLARTAVVTFTRKAADQIARSARRELRLQLGEGGGSDEGAFARLDTAYYGTLHSFCIHLARLHGSALGVHMDPQLVEEDDDGPWEAFLEQDAMQFARLASAQIAAFLRHASMDDVLDLAKELRSSEAASLIAAPVPARPQEPSAQALGEILAAATKAGKPAQALARNKEAAAEWARRFAQGSGRLPLPVPEGGAANIKVLYARFLSPVKEWLGAAGGVLAAELSLRYRDWRRENGFETYGDQVDTAVAVVSDETILERIRDDGWRILLDEAQDTDASQFSVLVEIARPAGAALGAWPRGGGEGPRPGHFCIVGDPQQGIYSSRADIRSFLGMVDALVRDGGRRLTFTVTFRAPGSVVALLNRSLPDAFSARRAHNLDPAGPDGAAPRVLQVNYEGLVAGPLNIEGAARILPLQPAVISGTTDVRGLRLADDARQLASLLSSGGPGAVGARHWGDICILAPRRSWLVTFRTELEAAGLKTSLQMKRNRSGDNPAYAWLCGLLSVLCDPENLFEWTGVLREVFGISDAALAGVARTLKKVPWDEAESLPEPMRAAVTVLRPFIERVDREGDSLGQFAADLSAACALATRADLVDPEGAAGDELGRLLAQAGERGLEGWGPREWLRDLLRSIDALRAWGRPARDAINMMTAHSAKGLEWPVVIPVGVWRQIGKENEWGTRILHGGDGSLRVILGGEKLPPEVVEAREYERLRELVRLLYVTLTRPKSALVIPWRSDYAPEDDSFGNLWGIDAAAIGVLAAPQLVPAEPEGSADVPSPEPGEAGGDADSGAPAPPFPGRILPHELSGAPDLARAALHESSDGLPAPARDAVDPLDYGVWWHEMLEFVPWTGTPDEVARHGAQRLAAAEGEAFQGRAGEEWARLLSSAPWAQMRDARWTALAEVGVFAPLDSSQWIDGVIDLVLHDPDAGEVWIVDWKTNRRREGEGDPQMLARLGAEYAGQLGAYGSCVSRFFPGCSVRLWIYSTVVGTWVEPVAS